MADIKEERAAYLKEWHERNPGKKAEYARMARKRDGAKISARAKAKRVAKGEYVRELEKASRERSPENFIRWKWSQTKAKRHGKKTAKSVKGIDSNYLIDLWHKQSGLCAITQKPMLHKSGSLYSLSFDRIDSNFGYVRGNVQLVCQAINFAKHTYTNKEILDFWLEGRVS